MTRHIRSLSIVERICADQELAIPCCDLRMAAVNVFLSACTNLDMPNEWIDGTRSMNPDIVASIQMLVAGVLRAVEAELSAPTSPLRAVEGGAR
jgi:hypothetical protein